MTNIKTHLKLKKNKQKKLQSMTINPLNFRSLFAAFLIFLMRLRSYFTKPGYGIKLDFPGNPDWSNYPWFDFTKAVTHNQLQIYSVLHCPIRRHPDQKWLIVQLFKILFHPVLYTLTAFLFRQKWITYLHC